MWLQFRANFVGRYIEMRMRRAHLSMHTEGIKAFSKRIRRCSVDGRKRYENDKSGRKSFWKRRKTAPFSFEYALVWLGPVHTIPFSKKAFWKHCFLVRTEIMMLSENGDNIKTAGHDRAPDHSTVSIMKMEDRRYHVASISRQFRGPIYWNAHASSSFVHAHWGDKSVFKTETVL